MDETLTRRVAGFNAITDRVNHQLETEVAGIARLKAKITQLETEKTMLVKAVGLIDRCIQTISANGIGKIESVITAGLRLVFNDPNTGLVVEKKEGARGISYRLLVRQGKHTMDPMSARGGGMVNIIAFLLRVILIKRFRLAQFIVLDEQFNAVSPDYQPAVSKLLHEMTSKYKYTIFAVTHQPKLMQNADHVYRLVLVKGVPTLKKIEGAELEELRRSNEAEVA